MERIETGDSRQFTVVMSVPPDANPWFSVYNNSNSLVGSYTSQQSGTDWAYYKIYTAPETPGYYTYEWNFTVSSLGYNKRGLFEIIKTDADWSGLYSSPNEVRALYSTLDTIKGLTNEIIQDYIFDIDTILNLRLSVRYDVPFPTGTASFPPMVNYLSKNYTLLEILDKQSAPTGDTPDWIISRREHLDKLLEGIEAGSYTLVDSAGNSAATESDDVIWSSHEDYHPIFTMLDAEYQQLDTEYEDELEDDIEDDS